LFFQGPRMIESVFGSTYASGEVLLIGLVLYAAAILWFENLKVIAMSQNVHRILVLPRIAQLVMTVVAFLVLVKVAGLRGAGMAAGLSACLLALVSTWQLYRQAALGVHARPVGQLGDVSA